ncbi:MAG: universal stress protein [Anaeromyxobacteraceae bacterium]
MTEISWTRVCCPVDFSAESRAALLVAADMARRMDAELVVLHVDERTNPTLQGQLSRMRGLAEAAGAPRVTTAHTGGHPKSAIARWVNGQAIDLVIMGTHGWTGRAHALVGSVAESTVRAARCPVMVVHGEWKNLEDEAAAPPA